MMVSILRQPRWIGLGNSGVDYVTLFGGAVNDQSRFAIPGRRQDGSAFPCITRVCIDGRDNEH